MDDDALLRKRLESVREAVWEIVNQLNGRAFNTMADGVGIDLKLQWSYNELNQIRSNLQSIRWEVFVIAVAVITSVWRHW
jgi:hypothetical protein